MTRRTLRPPRRRQWRFRARRVAVALVLAALPGAGAVAAAAPFSDLPSGANVPVVSEAAQQAAVARLVRFGRPVYCGGSRGRDVALSFDDGPGPQTETTLETLDDAGVRASFFLIGRRLARFPEAAAQEAEVGSVGDHTWTHPVLTRVSPARVRSELARTQDAIEAQTETRVDLFRPPHGAIDRAVARIATRLRLLVVMWSVDSHDSWPHSGSSAAKTIRNVERFTRPGAIVLMHENRPNTTAALPSILASLRARGLRPVSIPELLAVDPPSRRQLLRGIVGCPGGLAGTLLEGWRPHRPSGVGDPDASRRE